MSEGLLSLKQGKRRVAAYAIEFWTVAFKSKWNLWLKAVYWQGLNNDVITKLVCHNDTASLDTLFALSIHQDNLLCDRWAKHRHAVLLFNCGQLDILPGTTPSQGCVYPLSPKDMEAYMQEAFKQYLNISPSTSPVSAVLTVYLCMTPTHYLCYHQNNLKLPRQTLS